MSESLPEGVIRTADERFQNLPGYDFEANYVDVGGVRMHYVDEGRGEVVLCLHGEPSWSYLYRKMIPILAQRFRVVAPDFIGFGKSDKYESLEAYTFRRHLDQLEFFVHQLDLQNITLVCQDWGGLLGLSFVGEEPDRFYRLVIMNTGLPIGGSMTQAFLDWRKYATSTPDMAVGRLFGRAVPGLPPEVVAAYDAPFPDARYKAGVRAFPALVPIAPDYPGVAEMKRARVVLSRWTNPALVAFSDGDAVTAGGDRFFCGLIPSCKEPITIRGAGHFLQEQKGEEIAELIQNFMAESP